MDMAYKKFEASAQAESVDEPMATIQPTNGNFVFNKAAMELFPASDYYEYYIDTDENELALQLCSPKTAHSYKATRSKYTIQMSAAAVLDEFGYTVREWEEKESVPVRKDGERLILELSVLSSKH